jgi:hypothetical protein
MDFIHTLYETELTIALRGLGRGLRGRDDGGNISLTGIVTMKPPCIVNIS